MPQRACVYVDGFNLHNRCLKRTPYKWLDLPGVLGASQFPDTITDTMGTLVKPRGW